MTRRQPEVNSSFLSWARSVLPVETRKLRLGCGCGHVWRGITNDEAMVDVIDWGPGRVLFSSAHDHHTGRGLAGMRERVTLFGGQVESGPAGTGLRVRARIPVRAPE